MISGLLNGKPRLERSSVTAVDRPFVVIQRNPFAGARQRKGQLRELVQHLHRRGLRPRMFRRREQLWKWMASPENLSQLRCLVAAGGDGTVGDLITRYPGVPLAVFPMGTENLLAKFLKIPRSGRKLADLIIDGDTRRLDLAQIGDRRFCLMAGIGLDAEIVRATHAARRGNIRRWQYIGPIWRAWSRSLQGPQLRVYCDDDPKPITGRAAFVVNQPAYALRFQIVADADGHDGQFDLRICDWSSRRELLWLAWKAWWGGWERLPQIISRTARRVTIESDRPAPVQIDGDPIGDTPVEIKMVPDALEVYAP